MESEELIRAGQTIGDIVKKALELFPDITEQDKSAIVVSVGVSLLGAVYAVIPAEKQEEWLAGITKIIPDIAKKI